MNTIGQPKRAAQNRANIIFRDELGNSPAQISKVVSDMDAEITRWRRSWPNPARSSRT